MINEIGLFRHGGNTFSLFFLRSSILNHDILNKRSLSKRLRTTPIGALAAQSISR